MAHEIETMAYANEVPWHGLGNRVDGDLTPDEMLVAAGLDWTVDPIPLRAEIAPGEYLPVDGKKAFVRSKDKKIMTIASDDWTPLQNRDMLAIMKNYVEAGGATLETAGSLRGGNIVWGLANLKHSFEVSPGDRVNGYLLLTTSHVVGRANAARLTGVRVVCANTLRMAEDGNAPEYRQSHLSEFDVTKAKAAIEGAHGGLAAAEKRCRTLHGLKIGLEDAVKKVLIPVFEPKIAEDADLMDVVMLPENQPKSIREIIESLNNAPGAEPGTGWGVLNGVTHWNDHAYGHNAGTRLYKSWIGDHGDKAVAVERKLLELAQ